MLVKYPRTPHLEGSKLQPGDSSYDQISLKSLVNGELIWEEKIDGANCGISFSDSNELQLQSRGHYLNGNFRESHFNLFKIWANSISDELYIVLGNQYIMYGEWCYAKHSVFYDLLPHYFLEFDVYDKLNDSWLSTSARKELLKYLPIYSVPVLHNGFLKTINDVNDLIKPSLYKSPNWKESMSIQANRHNLDYIRLLSETGSTILSEGLYIKHELDNKVIGRYKFIRHSFIQTIIDSGTHWADRPTLPNMLESNKNIFNRS